MWPSYCPATHTRFTNLPSWDEILAFFKESKKPSVCDLLEKAQLNKKTLIQPRCGVGKHNLMKQLLSLIESDGQPDILTLTIDSYTRLTQFGSVKHILRTEPEVLNGYPLVNHGFKKGRELNHCVKLPLQIRHGSPDARHLFEVSLASGITSFEGGGIGYNIPYCKNVPIQNSLHYWKYIDYLAGQLSDKGIFIDREFFGTLTAVLIPPSISLSMTLLEALLSAREGVRCFSIAYPQGGNLIQDIAALKAIRHIFPHYLPEGSKIFPVFHGYMGPFPVHREDAESLIFLSAVIARLGEATKLVYKTCEEAIGIPSGKENCLAAHISRKALKYDFNLTQIEEILVQQEIRQIEKEVSELVSPVLDQKDLDISISDRFEKGTLDVPFSANHQIQSAVIPLRDSCGAIRYYDSGKLPFSRETTTWNKDHFPQICSKSDSLHNQLEEDIRFFQSKTMNEILECIGVESFTRH